MGSRVCENACRDAKAPRARRSSSRERPGGGLLVSLLFCGVLVSAPSGARAEPAKLDIELNKLEAQGNGCRAFFVVGNDSAAEYEALKLDLVLFQPDGVIGRRFLVNLAPIKASKRTVKQFDLEGTPCDQVGSLLVNDVLECKATTGPVEDCLSGLTVKSLTKVQLSK